MMRVIGFLVCFSALVIAQQIAPLDGLANLSDAASRRASSADPTGGNADWVEVKAGAKVTLADIKGAGSIRHIWFTINSPSPFHLRELVLRMYWDGESDPSVEVPIGDFFGTGFEYEDVPGGHRGQKYQSWSSLPITVQDRALNCYFEMPFASGARVTISNDGKQDVPNLYFHIDYQTYPDTRGVSSKGRFHAQWRHETTRAVPESESGGKNVDGKSNYVFMEAKGQGQYVGTILNVFGLSTGWWGERDDMFFIDGDSARATINGTGMEDYFNNAWMFQREFNYPFIGYSQQGNRDWTGSHTMYRFHIEDPIYFQKSLRATIEHGHANDREDDYTSVAFWYQTEPHQKLSPLPPVNERLPNAFWKIQKLEKNLPN
ncbi:MAG TPA: glycoside hydrolase family 172 protein [Terriglobales bacterium]|nr:glycoside hydrolase family 172 protein [Terriglobales bacterium]